MPNIKSNQLDGFATVPQCLDNQFLPLPILNDIYQSKISAAQAIERRTKFVRREYFRSLLYSPEVVVNRAFALNEPAIYGDVLKDPESIEKLVHKNRLTILLMSGEQTLTALMENPAWDISKDGERAWRRFFKAVGEDQLRYLQLSADENEALAGRFPTFVRELFRQELPENRISELFKPVAFAGGESVGLADFKKFLEQQAEPWLKETKITRNSFYQRFILPDHASTFSPGIDPRKPFAFELKLLADLAYTHNLPTTLGRQSFIPMDMPSPLALPPNLFSRGPSTPLDSADVASGVCDRALGEGSWYYESQQAFLIPDWAELTARDICEIQEWPEWAAFKAAQRAIVNTRTPDLFDDSLAEFFQALTNFQDRLGREIESSSNLLRRLRIGAKVARLLVLPVVTWAGQIVSPGVAGAVITESLQEGIQYAIDVSVQFFATKEQRQHDLKVDRFIYRASGVRQNVFANIQETNEQRRMLERLAGQTTPEDGTTEPEKSPAQRA